MRPISLPKERRPGRDQSQREAGHRPGARHSGDHRTAPGAIRGRAPALAPRGRKGHFLGIIADALLLCWTEAESAREGTVR